ncbi:peptide/nickel transport system permease protein [Kineosphaera limosa]|uniref:Putative ABC transporter permease protein n=1 Tax=Kineosphaera limosa NBRC 100340 TaxID=1184609 RepID=K6WUY1_9MICO|nr:ABC transporter permease [Kineosphaera limosa]NYE00233.1 peptide/nickel transport system permease protein [Kineosphaera limosa]GAB97656.1 putative ABC transporter permease protein [Kineosphaera limosa NBRC 100340]
MSEQTNDTKAADQEAGAQAAETRGLSQGQIVRKRFMHNTAAVVSVFVFLGVVLLAFTSIGFGPVPGWWQWDFREQPPVQSGGAPTMGLFPPTIGDHPFGQDNLGRDLFAMTMRGTQMSLIVMFFVGIITGVIGVVVGATAGYFRGWVEGVLMRLTDVIIIIPLLVLAAVLGRMAMTFVDPGVGQVIVLGILIGLFAWTALARLVRAEILSLREREFVDAARLAGASDRRIVFKHILPNSVGVITVNLTLLLAAAVLTETALSYLGFGVQAPDWSLGKLISDNQQAFVTRPWLFWWPGIFIILICLSINFVGDGLRDAFDPRQKKFKAKKATESEEHMLDETDRVGGQGKPA